MKKTGKFFVAEKSAKNLAKTFAAALFLAGVAVPAFAADIQINVNGQALATDVPPTVLNNRVLLPLRACAEALDATVNYNAATGKIDVYHEGDRVELALNSRVAVINGVQNELDVEPQVMNSRTLIPLRFLGEALAAQVNWDAATASVNIVAGSVGSSGNTGTDEPQKVIIPSVETIANQALQQINSVRLQKELNTLVSAAELVQMASAHSAAMSAADTLANRTPKEASPAARAESAAISTPSELIACVDYSKETVYQAVAAWMTSETTRAILLDASAGYIGIAAALDEASNRVYITAEVMPHRAYFIGLPQSYTTGSATLNLRGRSNRLQQDIIIYHISDKNSQMYTDKQTITATGDGSYFTATYTLPAAGTYAIEASGCMVRVTYRP